MDTLFHATKTPNWFEAVTYADAWVHIGTHSAAKERASRVTVKGLRVLESHDVYSVRISDDARLSPMVVEDLDENWESLDTEGFDAFSYVNEHESAGDVSYFVRARVLTAVYQYGVFPPDS